MEILLITPDEAKSLAKKMFISYHPNNEMWFNVAWEVLEENELQHKPASDLRLLPGLAATGETSSEMSLMVDDFAMFFEVFMTKDPVRGIELAERIQNIATRRSGRTFTRDNMIKRFSTALETTDNDKFHSMNEMIKERFVELSGQISELEGQIHIGSSIVVNEIKEHFKHPIEDDEYEFNAFVILSKGSFRFLKNDSKPFRGKGILTLKGGCYNNIEFNINAPAFVLLYTLAIGCKDDRIPLPANRFFRACDIESSVGSWAGNKKRYSTKVISRLKKEELVVNKVNYSNLIRSKHGHGYSINTNPQNIILEPDLKACLKKEVSSDKLLEYLLEN